MTTFNQATLRDKQVLSLLIQGCTNREIGGELKMSPRTVKQHLRMLFLRAGILDGRKRVKLARHVREGERSVMAPCEGLNPKENQISLLVWKGLTNREIGDIVGASEQVVKNHLRRTFDKLGVWNRLELAMYLANHGEKEPSRDQVPQLLGQPDRSATIHHIA